MTKLTLKRRLAIAADVARAEKALDELNETMLPLSQDFAGDGVAQKLRTIRGAMDRYRVEFLAPLKALIEEPIKPESAG